MLIRAVPVCRGNLYSGVILQNQRGWGGGSEEDDKVMQPSLALTLMFVPEIQGAQSLSVLEVNTPRNPWRRRDILIPNLERKVDFIVSIFFPTVVLLIMNHCVSTIHRC